MIRLGLVLCLLASPLAAQVRYPDSGRVAEPALSQLNALYRVDLEQGYCVTRWHVEQDSVVVDSIIRSPSVRGADWNYIIFDCPIGMPTLHTHPSHWPLPSPTDVREGLIDLKLPFIAVQSGPDAFAFAITWGRIP